MDKIKLKDVQCDVISQLHRRLMHSSNAIHVPYRSMKQLKKAAENGSSIMAIILWNSLRPIDPIQTERKTK